MSMALALALLAASPTLEARAEIAKQAAAWNKGDLETAMQSYCPSAGITWVNKTGVSRGYDAFAQSMRDEFGRPENMGILSNEVIDARDTGDGSSLLVLRWSIMRDGKRLMGGISSQLWSQCQGKLRIMFEHAG